MCVCVTGNQLPCTLSSLLQGQPQHRYHCFVARICSPNACSVPSACEAGGLVPILQTSQLRLGAPDAKQSRDSRSALASCIPRAFLATNRQGSNPGPTSWGTAGKRLTASPCASASSPVKWGIITPPTRGRFQGDKACKASGTARRSAGKPWCASVIRPGNMLVIQSTRRAE